MPLRALLIIIAIVIIARALKRLLAGRRSDGPKAKQSGKMVQCATCGMYIPETEALTDSGRSYCSRGHLQEDRKR